MRLLLFCVFERSLKMKIKRSKKIKKLLHNQAQKKYVAERKSGDYSDERLHINSVTKNELRKKKTLNSALNSVRRANAKNELNKFEHSVSKHVRLKPYFDKNMPVKWLGIVSDITTPHKAEQVEGAILIDKISTLDGSELFDYHIWLNIPEIKLVQPADSQYIGIGDYIRGMSEVETYGDGKYGLGKTILIDAGIFIEDLPKRKIISKYDRGDDWILKLENTTAGESLREQIKEKDSDIGFEDITKLPGHVTSTYQPPKYDKFQKRLISNDKIKNETPLKLIADKPDEYMGLAKDTYAKRITENGKNKYIPTLNVSEIFNLHKRYISKSISIPYPENLLQKYGLICDGQAILLQATASTDPNYLLKVITAKTDDDEKYIKVPKTMNGLVGYLLYKQNNTVDLQTEAGQKAINEYLTWCEENNVTPVKSANPNKVWNDLKNYTDVQVAQYLHIPISWIENLASQEMIVPKIVSPQKGNLYAGTEITKLHKVMQANDDIAAKKINQEYKFYRAKDMAEMLGLKENQVVPLILKTQYKSLNKFYGTKVFDLVKEQIKTNKADAMQKLKKKELLSKFGTNLAKIVVKREIPKEENVSTMQKQKQKADNNVKVEKAKQNEQLKINKTKETEAPVTSTKSGESKKDINSSKSDVVASTAKSVSSSVNNHESNNNIADGRPTYSFSPISNKTKAEDNEKSFDDKKDTNNFRIVISTFTGKYYSDQFENVEQATDFIEKPLAIDEMNRFITAQSVNDNKQTKISIRAILEWTSQN